MNIDEYYAALQKNRNILEERKNSLQHHGILGQKWGVRRFQNPDGSYTEAGLRRYGRTLNKESKKGGYRREQDIGEKTLPKGLKVYRTSLGDGNVDPNAVGVYITTNKADAKRVRGIVGWMAEQSGKSETDYSENSYTLTEDLKMPSQKEFRDVQHSVNPIEYRKSLEDYYAMQKAHEKEVESLQHWGIHGMRWGRRRYQNEDGSLTEEGRRRYGIMERREEYRSKERLEREKTRAQIKATRAEADAKIKIAQEQARANADMQARIARENAKAQAKVAKEQGKAQAKIAREQAKAEALKEEAKGKAVVETAKQDVAGIKAEAKEATKQKRIAAQVQIQDDRVRGIQNNMFRKLILGGAAVAGAAALIKIWRGSSINSSDFTKNAAIGEKIISSLEDENNFLKTQVSDLKSAVAKNGESAAQSIIEAFKNK